MIVVVGVPGVGKTVLGVRLARKLGKKFTTISWIVLEKGLWRNYDWETRSFVVDEEKLVEVLRDYREFVVETHWLNPFYTVREIVELVVLVRCNPLILLRRLRRRNWPPGKIRENVEAELLGVLVEEARRIGDEYSIPIVEVVGENNVEEIIREVYSLEKRRCCIDWMSILSEEEQDKLFSALASLENR